MSSTVATERAPSVCVGCILDAMHAKLLKIHKLDSTNTYAKAHLGELHHGTVIVADVQTAGRGQRSHHWRSDIAGNIYASIILKPTESVPDELPVITQVLAAAIISVLRIYGVQSTLKWPNDVMVGGKKIAGILAEAVTQGSQIKGVVLGFGVNLAMPQEVVDAIDQPATSLNLLINEFVDRDEFLQKVVDQFLHLSNQ